MLSFFLSVSIFIIILYYIYITETDMPNHHHFQFSVCFLRKQIQTFFMNDLQAFLSLACFLFILNSFKSVLITSLLSFLGRPLANLPQISNFEHLLSLKLFYYSFFLDGNQITAISFSLSSLTLHIHLTILASFFSSHHSTFFNWPNLTLMQHNTAHKSRKQSLRDTPLLVHR